MHLSADQFSQMDSSYRRNFFNSLPGPRGLHLIGTKGHKGVENLALFSSVVHLGATPPLLGFVMRPLTIPRHTYHHIRARKFFTINTVHPDILNRAHQTSANYPAEVSEFAAVGLTPFYTDAVAAPYVQESRVKLGLRWREEYHIAANDTLFIVGEVVEVLVDDKAVDEQGRVLHAALDTITVSGLDTYYINSDIALLPYAKPTVDGSPWVAPAPEPPSSTEQPYQNER